MTDTIVLLEEQKEITTFLLDDGTKTIVNDVITPTGSNLGFEYSDKCMVDDILCISEKSQIGSESLKKFTGTEVPVGILVNEPVVMTNGDRKGRVLLLGGLYRLKLSSSQTVKPGDRIKLTSDGATVDNDLDIVDQNSLLRKPRNVILLGHNDFDFLAYNYLLNCYQIIDRDDLAVLDTYEETELDLALAEIFNV